MSINKELVNDLNKANERITELEAELTGLAELREAARDIVNYISTRSRGRENHYGGRLLKQTDKLAALLQEAGDE